MSKTSGTGLPTAVIAPHLPEKRYTDTDKLPENSTWYVMTKIPGVKFFIGWQYLWLKKLGRIWTKAK